MEELLIYLNLKINLIIDNSRKYPIENTDQEIAEKLKKINKLKIFIRNKPHTPWYFLRKSLGIPTKFPFRIHDLFSSIDREIVWITREPQFDSGWRQEFATIFNSSMNYKDIIPKSETR